MREQLTRWTAAGLIAPEQAAAIEAAEAARAEADEVVAPGEPQAGQVGAAPHRALPLVVEALGYVGAVIAIAAGSIAVHLHWPTLPPRAELAFSAAVCVVLLVVGSLLRTVGEPALGRLRSALWLISAIGMAAFVAVLSGEFWHLSGSASALLAEGTAGLYAIGLWWRSRAALQQLAAFAAVAAFAGTAIGTLAPGSVAWGPGLAVWGVSVLWGIAEFRRYLLPRTVGYVAAGFGVLLGAQLTMDTAAGQVLAMATVAGVLAVGVALRRVLLVGFGAVGAIMMIPQTATRYLPGSGGALAVAAVGLVLLGVTLWLAKSSRTA
jgi:hypothetical protein